MVVLSANMMVLSAHVMVHQRQQLRVLVGISCHSTAIVPKTVAFSCVLLFTDFVENLCLATPIDCRPCFNLYAPVPVYVACHSMFFFPPALQHCLKLRVVVFGSGGAMLWVSMLLSCACVRVCVNPVCACCRASAFCYLPMCFFQLPLICVLLLPGSMCTKTKKGGRKQ